jgi:thiosulfate/3-mercaptopyruvate sulfurtransferase
VVACLPEQTESRIKSVEWLKARLGDPDVVAVDCRFVLGQPDAGRAAYEEGHIPGAQYIDLEKDMSGPVAEHGGRHPLPDLGAFALTLERMGIDENVQVIAYDDQGGAMASRFVWMLHFLGCERAYLLDGGASAWRAAGGEWTAEVPKPVQRTFMPRVKSHLLASASEVKDALGQPGVALIDSREEARYLGLEEPIDRVAGHIPGAINHFWKQGLRSDGRWKSADEQRERFATLGSADELIVYCGSGVTACPNVLALWEAGFNNVRLYSGSWSDWISYEGNPIATGEE